jgi:tRNA (guanosine-2'-O-)-methyltransferase
VRGYYGIGIYKSKTTDNVGTLWRSAQNFRASFIFTIAYRYHKQPSDTGFAFRHVPLFEYQDWEDFKRHVPKNCEVVIVEQTEISHNLQTFSHPQSAIYVLGAEDEGFPLELMHGLQKVMIETPRSLNVAVAGSIVMYDRHKKELGVGERR